MPFTAADIRQLARDAETFVRRRVEDRSTGFGYPQRHWIHEAVGAYCASGRDLEQLAHALSLAMQRGRGRTPWKQLREPGLQRMLDRFALLDARGGGTVRAFLYEREAPKAIWLSHSLVLPLGFLVEEMAKRFVRVLWTEASMPFRTTGSTMVVAATLAYAETRLGTTLSGIEVWQLRHGQERFFHDTVLRSHWARLDSLLTCAETRLGESPAA